MGLHITETPYEIPPAETTLGVCIVIADLGLQKETYMGQERIRPKIALVWELPQLLMEDGRPFVISEVFTASIDERSRIRKILTSWRGRDLSPEEIATGYDFSKLLGQWCAIGISHTEKNGKKYANISSVTKLMAQLVPIAKETQIQNELISYDLDNPDEESYKKLFPWIQKKIESRVVSEEEWEQEANEALEQENSEDIPF